MRYLFILPILIFIACHYSADGQDAIQEELEIEIREFNKLLNESYRGISVLDSNTVWISGSGGAIVRSLDGGMNWQIISPPDNDSLDFRDVHAFSANSAIVSSAGFPARVYLTNNSGEDWDLVYENKDSSAFLNSIHFKDEKHGLILGDRLNGYHFILRTEDSGRSWKRIDSSKLPISLEVEHGFAASGSCITLNVSGDFVIGLGGENSRVFIEDKNGQWNAYKVGLGDSLATSGIYSIASSERLIMAVGGDYTKADSSHFAYFSEDGGRSWEEGGLLKGYRSVVDHCSVNDLWLSAGINGIEMSRDGGKHWRKIDEENINTLQFDDQSGSAFAAGPNGKLYLIKLNVAGSPK